MYVCINTVLDVIKVLKEIGSGLGFKCFKVRVRVRVGVRVRDRVRVGVRVRVWVCVWG